jgi:hypothetical protein
VPERRDVQSSLADMDRKLRELQRELAMVGRSPEEPAPPPVPDPPQPPLAAPAEAAAEAGGRAEAIVADARAEAAHIVDQAAARVAAIGEQIDELQRLRDDLQRSARALVDEYERALRRGAADGAAPPAAPTLQEQAGAFPPPAGDPAPPPPAAGERLFEGQIVVNAGPFTDIATLGDFEQALAGLPQAEDVYVRGFEGNRALIDVKLAGPVALLDEMRRGLPFDFGLVDVGHGRITIDVQLRR